MSEFMADIELAETCDCGESLWLRQKVEMVHPVTGTDFRHGVYVEKFCPINGDFYDESLEMAFKGYYRKEVLNSAINAVVVRQNEEHPDEGEDLSLGILRGMGYAKEAIVKLRDSKEA